MATRCLRKSMNMLLLGKRARSMTPVPLPLYL
jgi:hypothetical protein